MAPGPTVTLNRQREDNMMGKNAGQCARLWLGIFLTGAPWLLFSCTTFREPTGDSAGSVDRCSLEPHRPQIHYSREVGWLSDPNGLYYLDGEWHLMFQGFPARQGEYVGTNWDHAVSTDLLHWEHRPTVLQAADQVSYYSGCGVVDNGNVSGLGTDDRVPVLAFYTTHFMSAHPETPNQNKISIAHSLDNGVSWSYGDKHPIQNPEFPHERDPSVFWHEGSGKWIMATAGTGQIRFYSSGNLLDWKYESSALPYPSWECPDLSTIKVRETGEDKVLLITSTNGGTPNSSHGACYHIGTFDGTSFLPDDPSDTKRWLDWGTDSYAGITYSNAPDGRILFQSWFGWPCQLGSPYYRPTRTFVGIMQLIRELTLHRDEDGCFYIRSNPIEEYRKLRSATVTLESRELKGSLLLRDDLGTHEPIELELTASGISEADRDLLGIRLSNDYGEDYTFSYDAWNKVFLGDRTSAGAISHKPEYNRKAHMPYAVRDGQLRLRIFFDVSTIEVFVDDGREVFSQLVYPRRPWTNLEIYTHERQGVHVASLRLHSLKSIWGALR